MPTALSAALGLAINARCASSTSAAETCPPGVNEYVDFSVLRCCSLAFVDGCLHGPAAMPSVSSFFVAAWLLTSPKCVTMFDDVSDAQQRLSLK